jgi:hypothetical protein
MDYEREKTGDFDFVATLTLPIQLLVLLLAVVAEGEPLQAKWYGSGSATSSTCIAAGGRS